MTGRVFTADYVEHATLRDGTPIILRLVTPDDKELLRRGFEGWSQESRYARFLVAKQRLTAEELEYLCDVDQETHFACGAIREGDGEPRGLGIARFVRLPDREGEPVTAEPAIAVADEVQHKGLGTLLLQRLVDAAVERGIQRFRCEVLATNQSITQLLQSIAPGHKSEIGGGVMSFEFALPTEPGESSIYRLLRAAAVAK